VLVAEDHLIGGNSWLLGASVLGLCWVRPVAAPCAGQALITVFSPATNLSSASSKRRLVEPLDVRCQRDGRRQVDAAVGFGGYSTECMRMTNTP